MVSAFIAAPETGFAAVLLLQLFDIEPVRLKPYPVALPAETAPGDLGLPLFVRLFAVDGKQPFVALLLLTYSPP